MVFSPPPPPSCLFHICSLSGLARAASRRSRLVPLCSVASHTEGLEAQNPQPEQLCISLLNNPPLRNHRVRVHPVHHTVYRATSLSPVDPMSVSGASAAEAGVVPVSEVSGDVAGGGEGSSSSTTEAGQRLPRTLDEVMRAPSSTQPDVIVLESLPEGLDCKEVLNPKEDLWLTTADGYVGCSSAVLPLTCDA